MLKDMVKPTEFDMPRRRWNPECSVPPPSASRSRAREQPV